MTFPDQALSQGPRKASALRQSAFQRLGIVAIPALALWLAVAFALDLFA